MRIIPSPFTFGICPVECLLILYLGPVIRPSKSAKVCVLNCRLGPFMYAGNPSAPLYFWAAVRVLRPLMAWWRPGLKKAETGRFAFIGGGDALRTSIWPSVYNSGRSILVILNISQ